MERHSSINPGSQTCRPRSGTRLHQIEPYSALAFFLAAHRAFIAAASFALVSGENLVFFELTGADTFGAVLEADEFPFNFAHLACWAAAIFFLVAADMIRFPAEAPAFVLLAGVTPPSKAPSFSCKDSICSLI